MEVAFPAAYVRSARKLREKSAVRRMSSAIKGNVNDCAGEVAGHQCPASAGAWAKVAAAAGECDFRDEDVFFGVRDED